MDDDLVKLTWFAFGGLVTALTIMYSIRYYHWREYKKSRKAYFAKHLGWL